MQRARIIGKPSSLLFSSSSRRCLAGRPIRHKQSLSGGRYHSDKQPQQNLIEKIVERHVVKDGIRSGAGVSSGDILYIGPAHVMTHDNTYAVMSKFASLSSDSSGLRVANPQQPVLTLDHNVQDRSAKNLARYAAIEAFAQQQGIDFWPAGRGIGHQVLCEEGYIQPGWMVVASDSHSNMYGALGALGTPIVRTDAAGIWATGSTWWRVPPVTRVWFQGQPRPGVTGKDVIIGLCGLFDEDEVLNHAIEFAGPGLQYLKMEDRLTIANMSTEWGALAGVFPVDDITTEWLLERAAILRRRWGDDGQDKSSSSSSSALRRINISERLAKEAAEGSRLSADPEAKYATELEMDLSNLCPLVAGPNEIKRVLPVHTLESQKISVHKAYIVSCVNSRVSDLAAAAHVLRGKKVAPGVSLYIAAASSEVEKESRARGDWQALVDAGAIELPSGCGPCVGLGRGLLKDGEVAISATNRNFKGRMGSRHSYAYLASPAVVAQSAALGYIAGPPSFSSSSTTSMTATNDDDEWRMGHIVRVKEGKQQKEKEGTEGGRQESTVIIDVIPGFPSQLQGEVLLCPSANIDTDGIYAGKHCYEDLDAAAQAKVAMENYDPSFASLVKQGDVLVAGPNFGCGSSREQAATALRACGITVILAASANETFRRNSLNNALLVIECPALLEDLLEKEREGGEEKKGKLPATVRTGVKLQVDFARSIVQVLQKGSKGKEQVKVKEEYRFAPVGPVAQEIIVAGGLEGWVRQRRQADDSDGGGKGESKMKHEAWGGSLEEGDVGRTTVSKGVM